MPVSRHRAEVLASSVTGQTLHVSSHEAPSTTVLHCEEPDRRHQLIARCTQHNASMHLDPMLNPRTLMALSSRAP